jgi:terminase small subunit / prophage DNA-packing protein
MARSRSGGKVLNSADETDEFSAALPDIDEDSAPPANKKDAAKLRLVSLKQAGALLDRDRNTIQKWLDQGCPYVARGWTALEVLHGSWTSPKSSDAAEVPTMWLC